MGPRLIRVYRYTSTDHLPHILNDGFLKTVESNISFKRDHAGPDVVWLSINPDPQDGTLGLAGSSVDKLAVRFTVELPKRLVHKWQPWALAHGSSTQTIESLISTGGGASSWRVYERSVPSSEWVEVLNRRTGELYGF